MWAKLVLETGGQGVAGPNPVSPTENYPLMWWRVGVVSQNGIDSGPLLANQRFEEQGQGRRVFGNLWSQPTHHRSPFLPSVHGCLKEGHEFGVETLLIDFLDDGGIGLLVS